MAKLNNLVFQTTTTTGNGNLTLAAVDGYNTFATAFPSSSSGSPFYYFIRNRLTIEWEYGLGYLSTGDLVRMTVLGGSNGTTAVVFSAGTKDVVNDIPASFQEYLADSTAIGQSLLTAADAPTARTTLGLGSLATASSIDLSTASATGTLAAARFPALTGDITTTAGSLTTAIGANKVTLAQMATTATGTVMYRKTASTGNWEAQTLATLKADLGLTGTNSGDQTITLTSDVTGSGTGSFATTIAAGAVTNAKLAFAAANTVKVNNTASAASPTDLALAASQLLGRGSTGDISAIVLGTGLSMSGSTLNAAVASDKNYRLWFDYASGTWTTPVGSTTSTVYKITLVGGGGGGGGSGPIGSSAGGGGGGAIVILYINGLAPSTSYSFTIGAGGSGGRWAGDGGGTGGSTTLVIGTTTYTAGGGTGGAPNGSSYTYGGAGGTATNGTMNITGNNGNNGLYIAPYGQVNSNTTGAGVAQNPSGGNGANGLWGMGGGRGGVPAGPAGYGATWYGAGGGGGGANNGYNTTGGTGHQGIMIVEWLQ